MNREDRDILVLTFAPKADPDNARGVLAQALAQFQHEIGIARTAFVLSPGTVIDEEQDDAAQQMEATLAGLSARVKAFQAFAARYLDVEFRQETRGA